MRNKRVLVDSDGVMSDLLTPAIEVINKVGGYSFKPEDVKDYNICEGLGVPHMWTALKTACATPSFVRGFGVIPGSLEGVKELRQIADVYAVTTPMTVPTWAFERALWLDEKMGFTKDFVVQTEAKHVIEGDILIDDKPQNVEEWAKHHPEGLGIIFNATYNRDFVTMQKNIVRALGWKHAVELCRAYFTVQSSVAAMVELISGLSGMSQ